jgi:hypothetical protein
MATHNLQNTKTTKKQLFFLIPGKTCPLSFNAVLVYSFLVYRYKAAKGDQQRGAVTRQQIHRGTGLSDTRTIPDAIAELEQHGLVGWNGDGDRVFPWEPKHEDWFVGMKNPGMRAWHSRIAYFPIWIPMTGRASGLVPRVNALYFLIRQTPNQRQAYYALKLKISEGTVRSGIQTLRRLRLISPLGLSSVDCGDEQLALWQDRKSRKEHGWRLSGEEMFKSLLAKMDGRFKYFQSDNLGGRPHTAKQMFVRVVDWLGRKMHSSGYSRHEITKYWTQVMELFEVNESPSGIGKLELFLDRNFHVVFEYAHQQTLKAASAGTFTGVNSFGLLMRLTHEAFNDINVAWDMYSSSGLGLCTHQWQPRSER